MITQHGTTHSVVSEAPFLHRQVVGGLLTKGDTSAVIATIPATIFAIYII